MLLICLSLPAYVSIRQHTPAYVSICQHTHAVALPQPASIRQHTSAYVSIRQHTSAYVSIHMLLPCLSLPAYASIRQHTSAHTYCCTASACQHTSAYVSTRQHMSAYVIIRQHTSAYTAHVSICQQHTLDCPDGCRLWRRLPQLIFFKVRGKNKARWGHLLSGAPLVEEASAAFLFEGILPFSVMSSRSERASGASQLAH
jgi:hypothetical protein